jgi:hypothetical protein
MALAVNRTGVILKKRDMSYHRPASVERCATAIYQSTWPGNTIERCPRARRFACRMAGRLVRGASSAAARRRALGPASLIALRQRRTAAASHCGSRSGATLVESCDPALFAISVVIGVTAEFGCFPDLTLP